jgi:hypothetical protein
MKKLIFLLAISFLASGLLFSQTKTERLSEYIPTVNSGALASTFPYNYSEIPGVAYHFVDITSTGTLVISGDDEGTPVTLGKPFEFYGEEYSVLAVTTNGYLSTLSSDDGPDFSNDCPLPAILSTGGGNRIYAYHDDIVSDVYYQYFSVSPIQNPRTAKSMGASIFQWVGTHFGGSSALEVEAVLFENGDIYYSTKLSGGEFGSGATFGIQNEAVTEGLTLSCNNSLGSDEFAFFISGGANVVPVSFWAILSIFGLMAVFVILRFKRII